MGERAKSLTTISIGSHGLRIRSVDCVADSAVRPTKAARWAKKYFNANSPTKQAMRAQRRGPPAPYSPRACIYMNDDDDATNAIHSTVHRVDARSLLPLSHLGESLSLAGSCALNSSLPLSYFLFS